MPPRLASTPAYSSNIELYGDKDSAGLTPRTPFSRQTANAEEGRSRRGVGAVVPVNASIVEDEDDGNLDEIDLLQTQSHPLLASSASDSFPVSGRSRGVAGRWSRTGRRWQRLKERLIQQRVPIGLIVGSGFAFMLLFMAVVSIKRPDKLRDYMGVNSTAIAFEALDEESKARFNGSNVINYAGFTSFPLSTHQYIQQCWNITNDPRMEGWVDYWEQHTGGDPDVLHKKPSTSSKTCSSSITYLLDGTVGLMADLAHLAQVAGFARERNRTLFIHDDNWNRGRWTDHFLPISQTQPGPEPGCAPPPPDGSVGCMSTDCSIVSARIAFFHMGEDFQEAFEDAYKYTIERKKPVFERAAESLQEAIFPSATNEYLLKNARDEMRDLMPANSNEAGGGYIAAHIRRGDREAMSWRYQSLQYKHIPTSEYVEAVMETYSHFRNLSNQEFNPIIYLASDSPSAASQFTDLLTNNGSYIQTHDNETIRPVVYELRTSSDLELRSLAPAMEYVQTNWTERAEEDRIRETRGMIVDWALLSGAWGPKELADPVGAPEDVATVKPIATICGLTSNICKLAPLGIGWNRSFDINPGGPGPNMRWVEIDNRGNIAPIWEPFEFFKNI